MMYSFEKLNNEKKQNLYKKMWDGTEFSSKRFISKKNWTGKESKDSFFINAPITSFLMSKLVSAIAVDLANAFDINDEIKRSLFIEKTEQACSGSGEEVYKISTMHSSSLCSLLFFYGISPENKLEIEIGVGKEKKSYLFTKSVFEFQNKVMKRGAPSNMDIVLLGSEKYDDSKKVILFLESKFSEYYADVSTALDISISYLENAYGKEIYDKLIAESNGKYTKGEGKDSKKQFKLSVAEEEYLSGIKQMISHYIGVRNLITDVLAEKQNSYDDNEVKKLVNNGAEVLLGTILFDNLFENIEDRKKYYDGYKGNYKFLAKILNEVSRTSDKEKNLESTEQLIVLEKPLTYAGVFLSEEGKPFALDEKVKKYYFSGL